VKMIVFIAIIIAPLASNFKRKISQI